MIIWILTLTITVGFYFLFTKNFNYWQKRNVRFVKPTWLFGNIFPIVSGKYRPSEYISKLHNSTDEPYLGLFVFNKPFLLIRDLEIIKHILVRDYETFINRSLKTSKHDRIGSNVLVLRRDEQSKITRKALSPVFTPSKLKGMLPLILEVCDDLIRYIEKVEQNDFQDTHSTCVKFAVDLISSCLFGMKACCLETDNSEFFDETVRLFEPSFTRAIQNLSCFFVPQLLDTFNMTFLDKSSLSFMEQVFIKLLRERKASAIKRNDVIDHLNKIADGQFDEENLASLAISLLIAGYETTGSTLSFLIYELSRNHDVQKQLRKEVQEALKDHTEISYQAVMEIKYLEMAIKETLRMYPVIGFLDRVCGETYTIPQTGLVIEKGTGIYISTQAFHFDKQYFPNPEVFDPQHFSEESEALIPDCVYTPFGKGFRGCIGSTFAMLVLKVIVARIVMGFEIESFKDSSRVGFDRKGILLMPKGALHIKLKRIDKEL